VKTPARYFRAFFIALSMTIQGKKPPPPPHPELTAWTRRAVVLVDELAAALDSRGLNKSARLSIVVRLDGRPLNLDTIVSTLRYHTAQEYPSLLRFVGRFNRGAIQATNMNDLYWLSRLREEATLQDSQLQDALTRLSDHLTSIPK
jgi:hypothetical protein